MDRKGLSVNWPRLWFCGSWHRLFWYLVTNISKGFAAFILKDSCILWSQKSHNRVHRVHKTRPLISIDRWDQSTALVCKNHFNIILLSTTYIFQVVSWFIFCHPSPVCISVQGAVTLVHWKLCRRNCTSQAGVPFLCLLCTLTEYNANGSVWELGDVITVVYVYLNSSWYMSSVVIAVNGCSLDRVGGGFSLFV